MIDDSVESNTYSDSEGVLDVNLPRSLSSLEDLDVYTETIDLAKSKPVGPDTKPIPRLQEETRGRLAQALVLLFAISSSFTMGYAVWGSSDSDKAESLLTLVLTSQVGLTSGALGFYFGQNRQDS